MRGAWLALLLLSPGCLGFLEDEQAGRAVAPADVVDDPATYTVSGFRVVPEAKDGDLRVPVQGGSLSIKLYVPVTRDGREGGGEVRFPVLYLFHPWPYAKEYFENVPLNDASQDEPDPRANLMQRFAEAGFITVAYDIRGFGRSDGSVTIASAEDLQDFRTVHDWVTANFPHSGFVGVAGASLGGGMSLRMLADSGVVDAAASIYGWADLYDALLPGSVPKAEWAASLYTTGQAGSHGRLHPEITEWLAKAVQRSDLGSVEAAMDARSTGARLHGVDEPLFVCQGLQESLFPQMERLWARHGGFVRTYTFHGGHSTQEPACWDRVEDWMHFFLRGADTGVDAWPFLDAVDADPTVHRVTYTQSGLEDVELRTRYLHDGSLVAAPSQRTFTVSQRMTSNPLQEPAIIGDMGPYSAVPERLRQDPSAVFFDSGPLESTQVILGNPVVTLVPNTSTRSVAYQVVATLYAVDDGGNSRLLARGSYANIAGQSEAVDVEMTWTKATVGPGSRVLLKLSANDLGWYMPMPGNYDATFTGASSLELPLF